MNQRVAHARTIQIGSRISLPKSVEFLALAVPIVAYLAFIARYAMNVIYYDSWTDVALIANRSSLWAQHNENRILFPNIITLLLGFTTHYNVVCEEFLSAAMLVAATGLFICAHKRRSPSTPWIYYLPVSLVMFSLVQAGDTLWGFQLAWYLVMLALAVTVFFLDRPCLTGIAFAVSIAAAVVGSFSSLQGLLIWPVGLELLWQRGRRGRHFVVWLVSAIVTVAVYFYHFDFGLTYSHKAYVLSHPIAVLRVPLFLIGNVFGVNVLDNTGSPIPGAPHLSPELVMVLGLVTCAVACWVLALYGSRRDESSASPVGVSMVGFGLLCAATIAVGRTSNGPANLTAGTSRYTTFTLLLVAGCYLTLLNRPIGRTSDVHPTEPHPAHRTSYRILRSLVVGAVCLAVLLGAFVGLSYGRYWHQREEVMADVTVNLDKVSNSLVDLYLFPGGAAYVRPWERIAAVRRLSLFATAAASSYSREGLFKELSAITTSVNVPAEGATVTGTQNLLAAATSPMGIDRVVFRLSGKGLPETSIAKAVPTYFGWFSLWNTKVVVNGTYQLQCVAYAANGKVADSHHVTVRVRNGP